jgi:hypothetical protein
MQASPSLNWLAALMMMMMMMMMCVCDGGAAKHYYSPQTSNIILVMSVTRAIRNRIVAAAPTNQTNENARYRYGSMKNERRPGRSDRFRCRPAGRVAKLTD